MFWYVRDVRPFFIPLNNLCSIAPTIPRRTRSGGMRGRVIFGGFSSRGARERASAPCVQKNTPLHRYRLLFECRPSTGTGLFLIATGWSSPVQLSNAALFLFVFIGKKSPMVLFDCRRNQRRGNRIVIWEMCIARSGHVGFVQNGQTNKCLSVLDYSTNIQCWNI